MNCNFCGKEMIADKFHKWQRFCKDCRHERALKSEMENRKKLTDSWVKKAIYIRSNGQIKYSQITDKMIVDKRKSIIEYRKRRQNKIGEHCKVYFKECTVCGKTFCSKINKKIICGYTCYLNKQAARMREKYVPKYMTNNAICFECGKGFKSFYKRAIFCSEVCARRAKSVKPKYGNLTSAARIDPSIGILYRALRAARKSINNFYKGENANG